MADEPFDVIGVPFRRVVGGIFALIGFFLLYSYKGYAAFYGTFRFPLCPEML
jgi:hypothetical protein